MSDLPLWTGLALVKGLDAYMLGRPPHAAMGVSIDSRSLQHDDLFIAIRGEKGDGHDFVGAAFEKGACAAVIDESHVDVLRGAGTLYVVRDTLGAMRSLGAAARVRAKGRIIAVTGSVGKTSTKDALRIALAGQGSVHASVASYNNHWGAPLTLSRMPAETAFGVFEIGMNHAGEIAPLATLVRPHVAIVTTIAPAHLENLGSLDAIADAKSEIFDGLETDGTAILHRDVDQFQRLRKRAAAHGARVLTFGAAEDADARLDEVVHHETGSIVQATIWGRALRFELGAPGRHFALNALAALLAVGAVGGDVDAAAAALIDFAAPKGRGRRVRLVSSTGAFTLIDESYNANPTSMRAAIEALGQTQNPASGKRIVALGDMLELGPEAVGLHQGLRDSLEAHCVSQVFASGPLMRKLYDTLEPRMRGAWAATAAELLEPLSGAVAGGDVVMIKGSNASGMVALAAALEERCSAGALAAASLRT